MPWQKGPLPKGVVGWGAVTPVAEETQGFYFAHFCDTHVKLIGTNRVLLPQEVGYYDASLSLPPNCIVQVIRGGEPEEVPLQGGTAVPAATQKDVSGPVPSPLPDIQPPPSVESKVRTPEEPTTIPEPKSAPEQEAPVHPRKTRKKSTE